MKVIATKNFVAINLFSCSVTRKIEAIQKEDSMEENVTIEGSLQQELSEWLLQNKIIWRQKSRKLWLKEGDKNSRFFHTSTIIRRRKNLVDLFRGDDGEWILDKKKISENFLSKFKTLFIEEEIDFPIDLEKLIQPSLTFEEN